MNTLAQVTFVPQTTLSIGLFVPFIKDMRKHAGLHGCNKFYMLYFSDIKSFKTDLPYLVHKTKI